MRKCSRRIYSLFFRYWVRQWCVPFRSAQRINKSLRADLRTRTSVRLLPNRRLGFDFRVKQIKPKPDNSYCSAQESFLLSDIESKKLSSGFDPGNFLFTCLQPREPTVETRDSLKHFGSRFASSANFSNFTNFDAAVVVDRAGRQCHFFFSYRLAAWNCLVLRRHINILKLPVPSVHLRPAYCVSYFFLFLTFPWFVIFVLPRLTQNLKVLTLSFWILN